jgi:hypothetical protein
VPSTPKSLGDRTTTSQLAHSTACPDAGCLKYLSVIGGVKRRAVTVIRCRHFGPAGEPRGDSARQAPLCAVVHFSPALELRGDSTQPWVRALLLPSRGGAQTPVVAMWCGHHPATGYVGQPQVTTVASSHGMRGTRRPVASSHEMRGTRRHTKCSCHVPRALRSRTGAER